MTQATVQVVWRLDNMDMATVQYLFNTLCQKYIEKKDIELVGYVYWLYRHYKRQHSLYTADLRRLLIFLEYLISRYLRAGLVWFGYNVADWFINRAAICS